MQLKTVDHKYTNVMEPISTKEDITLPPNGRQLISIDSQMYADTTVTAILQPSTTLTEDGDVAFLCCLGHIDSRSNYDPFEQFHRSSLYPKSGFACCPQDDLYFIIWETNLCDLTDFTKNELNLPNAANADNTSSPEDHSETSEQYLTDVDLQSTGRDETEDIIN